MLSIIQTCPGDEDPQCTLILNFGLRNFWNFTVFHFIWGPKPLWPEETWASRDASSLQPPPSPNLQKYKEQLYDSGVFPLPNAWSHTCTSLRSVEACNVVDSRGGDLRLPGQFLVWLYVFKSLVLSKYRILWYWWRIYSRRRSGVFCRLKKNGEEPLLCSSY